MTSILIETFPPECDGFHEGRTEVMMIMMTMMTVIIILTAIMIRVMMMN